MKKLILRTCTLMLFLCMCAPTLCACKDTDTQTADTQSTEAVADTDTANDTEGEENKKEPEGDDTPKWMEDGALKILTIGNSFSDDTMQYMYDIAKSAGVESISLGNLYIGGCSLNTHAANAREDKGAYAYRTNTNGTWSTTENYKMGDAVKAQKWDFISLQQASGSSGVESSYAELSYLIGYVKKLCPDAVIVWNMTWAYQGNSTHSSFPTYGSNQMTMYNAIIKALNTQVKTKEDIKIISPTGTAIQNARTSYIGDNLTRDGYHLTYDFGRYTAGLTFFSALTGIDAERVTFAPAAVDPGMQRVAREAAQNALRYPEAVSASEYKTEPPFDTSNYTRLEISWTPLGYWYSSHSTNHHTVVTGASNSKSFYASRMFTKEELPVGSVIMLADGWKYRPEGWKSEGVQSSRPSLTSASRVYVTEAWWGDYTQRAFNLSKEGSPSLAGISLDEINTAFVIWIPKN